MIWQAVDGAVLLIVATGVVLAVAGAITASPTYDDVRES